MAFAVTVDLALFARRDGELCVLVVQRANDPFRGRWALPGGFVEEDERLIDAARRELAEETGLAELGTELEQLGAYGDPGRDPRGRVVSVVYVAFDDELPDPVADSDAADARWRPAEELLARPTELAFDHRQIILDARERIFGI
jgi:8-oxo-dGTP diphosphatase